MGYLSVIDDHDRRLLTMRGRSTRSSPNGEPGGRAGVVVVRAWMEHGGLGSPRVRVTGKLDVESEEERVIAVTTSSDVVCQAVRDWLEEFAAGRGPERPYDGQRGR